MALRTRLDKVVWVRERAEGEALAALARATSEVARSTDLVVRAAEAAGHDGRGAGRVELWQLDDAAHHRAVRALRAAEVEAASALEREVAARGGVATARQDAEAVRRIQERRRAEQRDEARRQESRALDELATLRFNTAR